MKKKKRNREKRKKTSAENNVVILLIGVSLEWRILEILNRSEHNKRDEYR